MALEWAKSNSALQVAAGVEVAFLLITLPYFEGIFQNPAWAAVTVCVVISPNVGEGLKKCLLRVLGTFVGGVLGYGVLLALHYGPGKGEHLDCWQVNICLHLLIFPIYFSLQYLRKTYKDNGYAFIMFMLSFSLVISYCHTRDALRASYVLQRVGTIALGVVIGFMAMLLVFPIRAIEQLRKQINQTYLQLGALSSNVIDLYRMGTDTHNLTSEDIEKKRQAVFKGIAGLSEFRDKQTTQLEAAVKELRFVQLDKQWREKEQILSELIEMAHRIYFTMTTLYYMTAVEATGHMSETDHHVKSSAALLTRQPTAVRRTTLWQVTAMTQHYNLPLIKVGLKVQACLQHVAAAVKVLPKCDELAKVLDGDLLSTLTALEAEMGQLIADSDKEIMKRLREGQVGDADEMRGYTSVLSLLRLITLQLSNLGAQLDGWHDTMYVLLSWPGFKAVHLVGCVD